VDTKEISVIAIQYLVPYFAGAYCTRPRSAFRITNLLAV